ncbi:MAG: EsaB/YukD family protein [Halobacteria archaeon]
MGKLVVEVVDHTASRRRKAEIPDSMTAERVLATLVEKMGLPAADPAGQPITYHLDHKQSGKRLRPDQTLKQAGVQNGDVLRVFPRIEAGAPSGGPSPRLRRLKNERLRLGRLRSPLVTFRTGGDPPDEYRVEFLCTGLAKSDGKMERRGRHEAHILLPADYPVRPPEVRWLTPLFHPNILGSDHPYHPGKVCLGPWTPAQFLDDVVVRLAEMVQFKDYGLQSPLNPEAAVWAKEHEAELPVDPREVREPQARGEDIAILE